MSTITITENIYEVTTLSQQTKNWIIASPSHLKESNLQEFYKKFVKTIDNLQKYIEKFLYTKESITPIPKIEEELSSEEKLIIRFEHSQHLLDNLQNEVRDLNNEGLELKTFEAINKYVGEMTKSLEQLKIERKLGDEWKKLSQETETSWRLFELSYPKLEKKELLQSIWWFAEQGKQEHLDNLHETKARVEVEIKKAISQAEERIIDRHLKDLINSFNLSSSEFLESIENTIAECESVEHPDFQKLFDAKSPSQVIEVYKEIKDILDKSYNSEDVEEWLGVSNKVFEGNTPKEYLVKGKVFQILYFLKKVEWN